MVVPLARAFDAEVFATGSFKDTAYIERLGTTLMDYKNTPLADSVAALDLWQSFSECSWVQAASRNLKN
jgi:hypothetical protein